jgi:hypothetical protein
MGNLDQLTHNHPHPKQENPYPFRRIFPIETASTWGIIRTIVLVKEACDE